MTNVAPSTERRIDGSHDFAFLVGAWVVRNRGLLRPLSGSSEWEEFRATSHVRKLLHGRGLLEEWNAVTPRGAMQALSLHLYDPSAHQWRLHWATTPTVESAYRRSDRFVMAWARPRRHSLQQGASGWSQAEHVRFSDA